MKVREIMTTEVATAAPDTTLDEIAIMMKDEDAGGIPIVDDGELVGIITDRDIVIRCVAAGKEPADTTAEEVLSEELRTIEPDADVDDAADLMAQHQIRRLPVVEDGELVGIVALGDIAVKEDEDAGATDALEAVSKGVKEEGGSRPGEARTQGRNQRTREIQEGDEEGEDIALTGRPTRNEARLNAESRRGQTPTGRYQQGSARGRDAARPGDRNRAASGRYGSSGTRPTGVRQEAAQGISNRGSARENERQQKVNPQRAAQRGGSKRRRAS
jgi:CBS domain-containing protein